MEHQMLRIRMIEEAIAKRYPEGKMRCPVHLSIGQEAAAVGVCAALKTTDKMVSTHRGHAHYLAKGGSLTGLLGELYGKSSGCSRGHGGSMHLIDLGVGFYGSTSIVGGTIPRGVGLAFAHRLKDENHATVVCIGDAAVEEGVFHESANFAALHKLRVIFLCENNLYSCYTRINQRQPERPLRYVARAHNLHYFMAKENDVMDVAMCTGRALEIHGPSFIEVPTYRHLQHCGPDNDDNLEYRNPEEVKYWLKLDPLRGTEPSLKVANEIDDAFAHAEAALLAEPVSAYAD
jgi:pyruvate dehydrogenase E1 component alpha subunit